jgi:serine beta-lactamase-like protein LACTB
MKTASNRFLAAKIRISTQGSRVHFTAALLILASLIAPTLFTSRVSAQNEKLSSPLRSALESTISKFMATNHVPGLSVAVVEHAELVWSAGFGMADLEDYVPATPQTLYRLASISKPITATAAMQLSERGKLDLDAPIQKYCPAFPEKSAPITTRQLLGHLAGIRHYKSGSQDDLEGGNTKYFDDPIAAGITFFANDPLVAPPGTQFHYSTQGYTLVGCAIEGASGEKYVDYMRENIFTPAGMTATQQDNRFKIIPYRTNFYAKNETGAVENAEFLDSSYKIPGGGWLSNVNDMARFEIAILNNKLIKPATREIMWTPQKPSDGKPNDYALGWGIGDVDGSATVAHSGGQQGTSTFFIIAPNRADGVVILANMEDVDAAGLGKDLLKILLTHQAKN